MRYSFDTNVTIARQQFSDYVAQLYIDVKASIKSGSPIPVLRRKRLAWLMCERFLREVDYTVFPDSYQLSKLAEAIIL